MIPEVYTVGKVGSTTLSTSIEATGAGCVNIYSLNEDSSKARIKSALRCNTEPKRHHLQALAWMRDLLDPDKRDRFLIVTLFRDPIERALSDFFQNLETRHSELLSSALTSDVLAKMRKSGPIRLQDQWVDNELHAYLGLNPLAVDFDTEKGYAFITDQ